VGHCAVGGCPIGVSGVMMARRISSKLELESKENIESEERGSIVQNYTSLEIPENIATALTLLSPEQRQQVFDFVTFLSKRQEITPDKNPTVSKQKRVFGQYQGRISMSEDFDEPLPDRFWLGES
jgi:Protein of unknown function (DUF2281)